LPQLLGDERDERMRKTQRRLELAHENRARPSRSRVIVLGSARASWTFAHSTYQSQYSSQTNSYSAFAARSKR
jgi:hypothetical protein